MISKEKIGFSKTEVLKIVFFILFCSLILIISPIFLVLFILLLIFISYFFKKSILSIGYFREFIFYFTLIITLLLFYFSVSYLLPDKNRDYFVSICFIYIISITLLVSKFGEFLEERCILCQKYDLLENIQFPIFLLNFILLLFIFVFILTDAVVKQGFVAIILQTIFFSGIVSLCWILRYKIDILFLLPFVLSILLIFIHYFVFVFY